MDEWSKENTQFSVILLQMIYPPFVYPGKYVIPSTIKSLYPSPPPSPLPSPPPPGTLDHLERSNTMNSRGGKRT